MGRLRLECVYVCGVVWSGLVWSGLVWSGLVWSGLVCVCVLKLSNKSKLKIQDCFGMCSASKSKQV